MTAIEHDPSSERFWVEDLTIPQALAATVVRDGASDAVVFPHLGLRWSYAEFSAAVDRAARGMLALGIEPGEHVALWATNVPEWIVLQFATARIGAVLVTINPAYRPYELQYVLEECDARLLFLVERFKSSDYYAMIDELCPELRNGAPGALAAARFPCLRWVVGLGRHAPVGGLTWTEMCDLADAAPAAKLDTIGRSLRPTDAIVIQYTSGTTGFPKAATLSHRNLLMNVAGVGECLRLTAEDRMCIPVPFYHCFGCVLGTMCAAVHGAAMIIPAESFNPAATLAAVEQERATCLYGVPTMFIAELADPSFDQRRLDSLRTGIMSGSPCPIEVMRQVVGAWVCPKLRSAMVKPKPRRSSH